MPQLAFSAAAASRYRPGRTLASASLTRRPPITRSRRDLGERQPARRRVRTGAGGAASVPARRMPRCRHRRGDRYRACAAPSAAPWSGRGRRRARPPGRGEQRLRRSVVETAMAQLTNARLVLDAPRRRSGSRRSGRGGARLAVAECRDGLFERLAHVADVAAERDQRLSHDGGAGSRRRRRRRSRRSARAACGR